jgi:hypothetical protein
MPRNTRLRGHSLRGEGLPYEEDGTVAQGPVGRGKCQCGEMSEVLISDRARKAWHRRHKAELRT